jgi:carbon-monoxide dehydrogenase small subunit
MPSIALNLNGRELVLDVEPATLLIELLRGPLGLTGTHQGCDTTQCGCCTVLLDGDSVKACSLLAVQAAGRRITTIEGLARADGQLHPVQEAFIACHGLQCGFCTPGMVMTATCLLQKNPQPDDAAITQALEGNLCRCTGYVNIVRSVKHAASLMAAGAAR